MHLLVSELGQRHTVLEPRRAVPLVHRPAEFGVRRRRAHHRRPQLRVPSLRVMAVVPLAPIRSACSISCASIWPENHGATPPGNRTDYSKSDRDGARTNARHLPVRRSLLARTGLAWSPVECVGKPLTKTVPVLAAEVSCQHPLSSPLEFIAPLRARRSGIVIGRLIEAGQQLRDKISAFWIRQRERLSMLATGTSERTQSAVLVLNQSSGPQLVLSS